MVSVEMLLIFGLITKHFVADFLLQYPYQFLNKGIYGHPGGLLHAVICGIGSLLACSVVIAITPMLCIIIGVEMVIHYHIDWAKVQINTKYELHPGTTHFWNLLGLDQWLHYLTYVGMVISIMSTINK